METLFLSLAVLVGLSGIGFILLSVFALKHGGGPMFFFAGGVRVFLSVGFLVLARVRASDTADLFVLWSGIVSVGIIDVASVVAMALNAAPANYARNAKRKAAQK